MAMSTYLKNYKTSALTLEPLTRALWKICIYEYIYSDHL